MNRDLLSGWNLVEQAKLRIDLAELVVAHVEATATTECRFRCNDFLFEIALTPRRGNACATFPGVWLSGRYERLGGMIVIPPRISVEMRMERGSHTAIIARLHPSLVEPWLEGGPHWNESRLESCVNIPDRRLRSLLLRAVYEVRQPRNGSDRLIELIAAQMGIEFGRYIARVQRGPIMGGLTGWRKRLIEDRVQKAGPPPTVGELAALCGLSERQLARAFEKSYGGTIGKYVDETRIEMAKRLLISDEPIGAIAEVLGYSAHRNFSQTFRRLVGTSPSQFRQRHR